MQPEVEGLENDLMETMSHLNWIFSFLQKKKTQAKN